MKKTVIIAVLTLATALTGINVTSCSSTSREAKAAKKALQARLDSLEAVASMQSLQALDFALAADRVTFRHGGSYSVNPTINFVARMGERAIVQLGSPSAPFPGFNGMGGFTLDGIARGTRISTDKKGTTILSYSVTDKGMTCDITVRLGEGQTVGTADVDAGYGPGAMSLQGKISPYSKGRVVKGTGF